MPAPAKSLANTSAAQFEVLWNLETIGWTDSVDPSAIKLMTTDQTIGELSGMRVDSIIRGVQGSVKVVIHEVSSARIRQLMPWAAATLAFPINPAGFNVSMYTGAKVLRLHPKGNATAVDDMVWLKAYPKIALPKSAGAGFQTMEIEFDVFPDQAALTAATPTITFGYIGEPPV